jgi:hypothetical protein
MAMTTTGAKLAAAGIGGGALVTMSAMAFSVGGSHPGSEPHIASGAMQTGVTVTSTAGVETSASAVSPTVKATFFGKS